MQGLQGGGRRHSATESSLTGASYAEELAMTFAASRGQMLQGGRSLRANLRRMDTPIPIPRDSSSNSLALPEMKPSNNAV